MVFTTPTSQDKDKGLRMDQIELLSIEEDIKKHKESIALAEAVERLKANKDFKKVVMDGYFQKEAVRLVMLRAEPQTQHPDVQKALMVSIDSIANFKSYLDTALSFGQTAINQLASAEATREEILAGEE